MRFISPPPARYNPAKSRALLEGASWGLEIENARSFPFWVRDPWVDRVLSSGFELIENKATSFYLDTPNLDLFSLGLSNRVRKGAVVYNGKGDVVQTFPNQFALKSIHAEFQEAATGVAKRLFPNHQAAGVYPIIRNEIEGEHSWPGSVTQLRIQDLPNQPWHGHKISISKAIEGLIGEGKIAGIDDPKNLVLLPWVTTAVDRRRTKFFVAPDERLDFAKHWPSPEPTEEMIRTGEYLCIEAVVDKCVMRACSANRTIDQIAMAYGTKLGVRSLFEYEVVAKECGANLTDEQAIRCYTEFGIGMLEFANDIGQKRNKLNGDHNIILPTRSKFTTTLGLHPACRVGGELHETYLRGCALAA